MTRRLAALVLTAALALPFAAAHSSVAEAAEPTPLAANATNDLVTRVQAFYDKSATFTARFDQEFTVKAYNTKRQSNGTVYFQKPGKMAWVYTTPADNRVVSNGSTVRVYEAANKQMFEQQVNGAQSGAQYPAALSFLLGTGKLGNAFNFEAFEGSQMKFEGGHVLVGTPKTPTPAYTKVLFYVDAGTSQVLRVMIIDGQGNRNRFDFTAPKVNLAVQPTRFTFTPPQGTTIVRP